MYPFGPASLPLLPPLAHLCQTRNAPGKQGLLSHIGRCEGLDMGQGITELRARQDVLLPVLPAQEILP